MRRDRRALAQRSLDWLITIQRADGSFTDPDEGKPYLFDTGQVLRGLVDFCDEGSAVQTATRRAAEYLCEQLDHETGAYPNQYSGQIAETILL